MKITSGIYLLAFSGFVALGNAATKQPKNFIMVIPDGFGPASETLARDYVHWKDNATISLPIDGLQIGAIRTRASDTYVTDSAAAATAYSCGIKTYNGGIAVDDNYAPCGTVLEAAKAAGYKTGLVATSRITHATPASYIAHVWDRDDEANIAAQLVGATHPLGAQVDVLLGGGRCYFTPQNTTGSCRKDNRDVIANAKDLGYNIFLDRAGFDKKQKLPYLGLFASGHMSYNIDRDPKKEPSLTEMAVKALDDLYEATKKSKKGFFIMIEASRIDHAGHANDAAGHVGDILEYNSAMAAVVKWIDKHQDSPTLMLSAADHECGGLTVGIELFRQPDYFWWPEPLSRATASAEVLAATWKAYNGSDERNFLTGTVFTKYAIDKPTETEIIAGIGAKSDAAAFVKVLRNALSARIGVHWSTGGHTAVDVSFFGYGVGVEKYVGNHENTDVAHFAAKALGVDMKAITEKLVKETAWQEQYVRPPKGKKVKRNLSHLSHHH